MYIRKVYKLQTIAGKSFLFLRKDGEVDMTRILSFNKTSVWLWKQLSDIEFTEDEVFCLLKEHYEGDLSQMKQNLKWWIDSLIKEEIIVV